MTDIEKILDRVWFMYRKLHVNTAGEIYRIEEVPECLE